MSESIRERHGNAPHVRTEPSHVRTQRSCAGYIQVASLDDLRKHADAKDEPLEVILLLFGGVGRATRYVQYRRSRNGKHWWVQEHGYDGRYYTDKELARETNLIQDIEKGALYREPYESEEQQSDGQQQETI